MILYWQYTRGDNAILSLRALFTNEQKILCWLKDGQDYWDNFGNVGVLESHCGEERGETTEGKASYSLICFHIDPQL